MTTVGDRPPVTGAADRLDQASAGWVEVCPVADLPVDLGVAALVAGSQVAVFRLADGSVHALDHRDPDSGANVLARGIVGDADGTPFVASPVYKQRYDLRTGACLDQGHQRVRSWPARVRSGRVEVATTPTLAGGEGAQLASRPPADAGRR